MDTNSDSAFLYTENIGGIQSTEVQFYRGINVLVGENASNRSSLLQAIIAALGSDNVAIRESESTGKVELSFGQHQYQCTLQSDETGVIVEGTTPVDEIQPAELFAFLLESNEVREAVRRGSGFQELLFRPLDTEEIKSEIDNLRADLRVQREQLAEIERSEAELPGLKSRHDDIAAELQAKRSELNEKQDQLQTQFSGGATETDQLESKLEELSSLQSKLETIEFDIKTERVSINSLKEERQSLEEKNERTDVSEQQIELLDSQLEFLRERRRELDSIFNQFENIIQFNEELLSDQEEGMFDVLEDEDMIPDSFGGDSNDEDILTCWTCGNETDRRDISNTIEMLTEISSKAYDTRNSTLSEIDRIKAKRERLREKQRAREQLAERVGRIETEIEERRETVNELQGVRAEIEARIERMEDDIDEIERVERNSVLDLYEEISELEGEITRLEDDYRSLDDRITEIEQTIDDHAHSETLIESLESELEYQRECLGQLENEAITEFDERISDLIDLLDYGNIEDIDVDQTRDTAPAERSDKLQLRVVRRDDSGERYVGSVDNLSESEREIVGLMFALAGYLVHEVYKDVPFMLLDSLEAIDADHIATLVDYFSEYADHLVVALLPENARTLDQKYHRITTI